MSTPADSIFDDLDADAERRAAPAAADGIDLTGYSYDDMGNGRRLAAVYRDDIAWVPEETVARVWTGQRWETDTGMTLLHRAGVVADAMRDEHQAKAKAAADALAALQADENADPDVLATATADVARMKAYGAWIAKTRQHPKLLAMKTMALADPTLAVHSGDWDACDDLLNVANCTIVLDADGTVTTTAQQRSHRLTQQASVVYNPTATCPRWQALLDRALPREIQRVLRGVLGLALRGGNPDHIFAMLTGAPRSGKTTIMQVVAAVLGNSSDPAAGYSGSFDLSLLRARNGGPDAQLYRLLRKRFVYASEGDDGGVALTADSVKRFCGGDARAVRDTFGKAGAMVDRVPAFSPMLATNKTPRIDGADAGLKERLIVFPFENSLPAAERDPRLPHILATEEGPGILRWMLDGYTDAVRNPDLIRNLPDAMVQEATDTNRALDIYSSYLGDLAVVTDDRDQWITGDEAWNTYLTWCRRNNESEKTIGSRRDLLSALKAAGHPSKPVRLAPDRVERRMQRLAWSQRYYDRGFAAADPTADTQYAGE